MARGCLLATLPGLLDSPVYFLGGWDAWQSLACLRRPLSAYRGPRYLKKLESGFRWSGSSTMSKQHRLHLVVHCGFIFRIILICFSRSIMHQCFSYLTSLTSPILTVSIIKSHIVSPCKKKDTCFPPPPRHPEQMAAPFTLMPSAC